MKRRLAAAILTATVTAGAMTLPAAAGEWDNEQQAACTETVQSPQQSGWQCAGGNWYYKTAMAATARAGCANVGSGTSSMARGSW